MSSENKLESKPDINLINTLENVSIFARANDNELQALAEISERKHINRGQIIIQAGDTATMLYILLRGRLLVFSGDDPIAEIAPVRIRPPSKYWLRYIVCQSASMRIGSSPMRNSR